MTSPARERGFPSTIPFDEDRIRAASVYCSDGRFGEQMDEFLHQALKLPRYDRLAVPGGPACFTGLLSVFWEGHSGERQLDFLCRVHGLERLVLIAHEGSADRGAGAAGGPADYTCDMAKFRGTVRRNDLEGGHWQLEGDDGTTYVLEGAPKGIAEDGAKVEIDGAVDEEAMGFAMTGPILKVKSGKRV